MSDLSVISSKGLVCSVTPICAETIKVEFTPLLRDGSDYVIENNIGGMVEEVSRLMFDYAYNTTEEKSK